MKQSCNYKSQVEQREVEWSEKSGVIGMERQKLRERNEGSGAKGVERREWSEGSETRNLLLK